MGCPHCGDLVFDGSLADQLHPIPGAEGTTGLFEPAAVVALAQAQDIHAVAVPVGFDLYTVQQLAQRCNSDLADLLRLPQKVGLSLQVGRVLVDGRDMGRVGD